MRRHSSQEVLEVALEELAFREGQGGLAVEGMGGQVEWLEPGRGQDGGKPSADLEAFPAAALRLEGLELRGPQRELERYGPRQDDVVQGVVLEHGHLAPGSEHPSHARHGRDGVRQGVEALGAPDQVEGAVWKRQQVELGAHQPAPGLARPPGPDRPACVEIGQAGVGAHDQAARPKPLCHALRVEPVAARKVEHAHAAAERQARHDGSQLALEGAVEAGQLVLVARQPWRTRPPRRLTRPRARPGLDALGHGAPRGVGPHGVVPPRVGPLALAPSGPLGLLLWTWGRIGRCP